MHLVCATTKNSDQPVHFAQFDKNIGLVKEKSWMLILGYFFLCPHKKKKKKKTCWKCISKVLLMSTHNTYFDGEVDKIIPE